MTALEYAEGLLSPVTEEHEAEARIIISELTALPINNHNFHTRLGQFQSGKNSCWAATHNNHIIHLIHLPFG